MSLSENKNNQSIYSPKDFKVSWLFLMYRCYGSVWQLLTFHELVLTISHLW